MLQQPDRGAADHIFAVYGMLLDMYFSMSLQEIVHLKVADHLSEGPQSVEVLAKQVGVQADMLALHMRTMCSKDIFVEIEEGVFAHTERSRYLQTDIPCSLVSVSELIRSDSQRAVWTPEALAYSIRTGKSAFEHILGENLWSFLGTHPEDLAIANGAVVTLSDSLNEVIAEVLDLTDRRSFVDVGGGDGSFLATLLSKYPETTGALLEVPPMIENVKAQEFISELAGRYTYHSGDFLEGVPEGGDAYLLKEILTHWNDEACLKILNNCRKAMAPAGRLYVIEYILQTPPAKFTPYLVTGLIHRQWFDEDYQRTVPQLQRLLEQAGFEVVSHTPTSTDDSILTAQVRA
ncbi:methyltransferase [Ktedonospora formicarum]|uniref:Methyltransferase n=1 Tax=Ktedonospora formicarum TaxID=2778364 RepID=A0A8J3MVJ2_9CHLR|nr:methyltransferase [Ktedonospora formicarum]GHO47996.1 methyltransferase [Ktedonospora formicarum]